MSIVEIDDRGRVTIPKGIRIEADRALVIPMGDSYMVVPLRRAPVEFDMSDTGESAKRRAEKKLAEDIGSRTKRRREK